MLCHGLEGNHIATSYGQLLEVDQIIEEIPIPVYQSLIINTV